uniref:MHC_I C-terminus family protein n=1 Tax=Mycena chlorophos TaxID=658473 RepID=A0ABQ0LXL6_MYCCL|nr:MHC_I C-terminus family protein [Mycena chlorophos]
MTLLSLPAELHEQIANFIVPTVRDLSCLSRSCSHLHSNINWLLYDTCAKYDLVAKNALAHAVETSDESLLERLAAVNAPLNTPFQGNRRPLHLAALDGKLGLVRKLLELYGSEAAHEAYFEPPFSPLYYAARNGHWPIVFLLAEIPPPADKDRQSYLADGLKFAAAQGNLDIVRVLLEQYHVNVNHLSQQSAMRENKPTALYAAVETGDVPMIELLLSAGADPNLHLVWSFIPLHGAVKRQNAEIVQLLLDAGADRSALDILDRTPLKHAMSLKLSSPGSDSLDSVVSLLSSRSATLAR